MLRILSAVAFALLTWMPGSPETTASPQAEARASTDELLAAQRAYIQANNAADLPALDRLTSEDWTGITADGKSQTRAEAFEAIRRRGPAKIQATTSILLVRQKAWQVRIYGDTGFVSRLTAGDHGTRAWVTGIWARRDGRWRRVFSQVTTVAP